MASNTEQAQNETPSSQLTLGTLNNVVRILQVCTQRGVFKPEELEVVGKTYNDLSNFLRQSVEAVENAAPSAATSAAPSAAPSAATSENNDSQENTSAENEVNVI